MYAKVRRREVGMVVDHPLQAILQERRPEVNQKSKGQVHESKISQELIRVDGMEVFD